MPEKCIFPPCSDANSVGVGSMNDCPADIDQKARPASDPASAFEPKSRRDYARACEPVRRLRRTAGRQLVSIGIERGLGRLRKENL